MGTIGSVIKQKKTKQKRALPRPFLNFMSAVRFTSLC
jgi:hypothetical protein